MNTTHDHTITATFAIGSRIESLLADKGIRVESGVAQIDEDGRFTIALQNYTKECIYLEEGKVIRHKQAAQIEQCFPPRGDHDTH